MAKKRSPEELQASVYNNISKAQAEHQSKLAASNAQFQNTRITTGKSVLMKNGKAVALAFPQITKAGDPNKNRSSETTSMAA